MSKPNTESPTIETQPYSDTELDAAMRELEAIEAGERDLAVLREVWKGRKARSPLTTLRILALALGMAIPATAMAQDAPAKPKRPTMCLHGKAITGDGFVGYVCLDGKRPRIFTRYIEVKFVDEAGKPRSYVLGWSAPVKRTAKGGYVAEGTPVIKTLPL